MDGTATPRRTSDHAPRAAQVFLGDARLALAVLNQGRYFALNRLFGVTHDQANLLTAALALGIGDAAYVTTRRVVQAPFPLSGSDAAIGGFVVREAVLGIAGPAARKGPFVATVLAAAMLAGIAVPGVRRTVHDIRAAEQRVRRRRMRLAGSAANRRRAAA